MTEVKRTTGRYFRLLLDILLVLTLILAGIICELRIKPKRIGFFCNDETLQYPYQPSTVSGEILVIIAVVIPLLLIIIVEFVHCLQVACTILQPPLKLRLFYFLQQFGKHYGLYITGLVLTFDTAEVAKLTIGRLRPHFMAVCQPQLADGRNCSDATLQGRYIEDYKCIASGFTAREVLQIRYSFPSHHSALSFYAMLYLTLYLQTRFHWSGSRMARYILQFCLLMLAWYISLTRIADHWHHWSDVLAGSAMGVTVALINALFIARIFKKALSKNNAKCLQALNEEEQLARIDDCIEQKVNSTLSA